MSNRIDFTFPEDLSDEWNGFNDPGIEHFSGNPYVHVGKEVPQNTLDATIEEPAKVDIQLINVEATSIPGFSSLRQAMQDCQKGATAESDRAKRFFDRAVDLLQEPTVAVLKISDENTTGVVGPCEHGKPYHAFMKATGLSKKNSDVGLGSFGIGKFAPFTVSDLRTIFVSTNWDSDGSLIQYVQGKAILMSHKDKDGRTHQAVGYWGKIERCQPVEGPHAKIPDWLSRKSRGTTLAVLGFRAVEDWEKLLAASIAQNYFGAIVDGKFVATVGSIKLDPESLIGFLENKEVQALVSENQKDPEQFREAGLFLSTLNSDDGVIVENTENLNLGNCELRIKVAENLPKKVAVLRDGMFITAELSGLKRFSDYKDFVAVFQCKSKKGNALLREMEPPRHDDFEPQRVTDLKRQRMAKSALRDISRWVRDMLKRHARDPVSEETTIDELAEYFADEDETQSKNAREGEENPRGSLVIRARPLKTDKRDRQGEYLGNASKVGAKSGSDESASGGGSDNDSGDDVDDGASNGSSDSSSRGGLGSSNNIVLQNVRAIPLDASRRRLFFVALHDGPAVIKLQISGADTNQPLPILKSSKGKIIDGSVNGIEVNRGQRVSFDVTLTQSFMGAIRISAHAV